jgi:hypothetical protein
MRLLAFIQYAALVIGAAGAVAGHFLGLPQAVHVGLATAGAGFALAGLEGLLWRRLPFRPSDDDYEDYAGTVALIVAAMALAIGAALIGSAHLLDQNQWHATLNRLMRRPAPLLAAGGLFAIGIGVLAMLNPRGRSSWLWRIFVYAPRSLLGVVAVAAGAAAIGLGAWEWLDPQASHAFMKTLPRYIAQP